MKKIVVLALLLATAGWAQSVPQERLPDQTVPALNSIQAPAGTEPTSISFPVERFPTPTYADLYCAGFISKHTLPDANFIAGGLETPTTTKFVRGDIVYLKGTGYSAGSEYEIIRALNDVNRYEMFPGQFRMLKETGQPYEEVGRVKVIDTRSKTAIAEIEYSCDGINPGDTAIPFAEKQTIPAHGPLRFDRFLPADSSKTSGRIVMAKDFDSQLGTGSKVYINVGSNRGLKIGDYMRVVRSYEADLKDPVDSLSFRAAIAEDTQKKMPSFDPELFEKQNGPVIHVRDLPRRAVGEIVILGVTDTTATGMIVFANEAVIEGDGVEVDTLNN
ncbi:MAG TPA: hypothetical protein VGS27_32395 [Candidatus Sulfotelmatobacter sp.]|nr:hypothetical protein [Candidatus Sulfotelmatobacter sp.]